MLIATIILPVKTISEANCSEHFYTKHRLHKEQQKAVHLLLRGTIKQAILDAGFPLLIRLTRIAPRKLDLDDNLPISMKSIRDYIADSLIPGLQPGRADSSEKLKWKYSQEKGLPKQYAVRVTFYKGDSE